MYGSAIKPPLIISLNNSLACTQSCSRLPIEFWVSLLRPHLDFDTHLVVLSTDTPVIAQQLIHISCANQRIIGIPT